MADNIKNKYRPLYDVAKSQFDNVANVTGIDVNKIAEFVQNEGKGFPSHLKRTIDAAFGGEENRRDIRRLAEKHVDITHSFLTPEVQLAS